MKDIAISLKNVSKYYKLYKEPKDRLKEALHPLKKKYHKPFYALKDLNLEIRKGDVIGVVGRNGCGKSTLLKLITGILQPNEGKISVKGKITALLELGAGFNPEFTGLENIYFYAKILGLTAAELEEKLPSIIDFAELGDFLRQPVKSYSSGMTSRLGFAVAVHVEPEILILDEVLAVGDALFKRKCYAKMEEFFKAGKTIIYVSHDANSVNRLCNRAVLIHEGGIIMDGEPAEVTKYYEKLLFSKTDNVSSVVAEITNKQPEEGGNKNNKILTHPVISEQQKPYLIPELISKALVIYRDYEVDIVSPEIVTLEGEPVNVLVSGDEYIYRYKVKFHGKFSNVSFGMMVKTESGQELCGSAGHFSENLFTSTQDKELVTVEWAFRCNLLSGVYYTNAGAAEYSDDQLHYLTRQVDALVFKVMTSPSEISRGMVNLSQSMKITRLKESLD